MLIDVHAAAVAGDDWHLMRGNPWVARFVTGLRRPKERIPGREFAGTVVAAGPRVRGFQRGDIVFGWCRGAFASQVAASVTSILPAPADLEATELAVVPTSGVTALQALRAANVGPGARVAIVGASGGVGTFAVQIAAAWGAQVTAVCGPGGADLVNGLGAARVVDYHRDDFTVGERYDAIIDLVGAAPLRSIARAITKGGTAVLVSASGGPMLGGTERFLAARAVSVMGRKRITSIFHRPVIDDLQVLVDMMNARTLTPVLSATYPLGAVPDAVEHFAAGHGRGKVAIQVS